MDGCRFPHVFVQAEQTNPRQSACRERRAEVIFRQQVLKSNKEVTGKICILMSLAEAEELSPSFRCREHKMCTAASCALQGSSAQGTGQHPGHSPCVWHSPGWGLQPWAPPSPSRPSCTPPLPQVCSMSPYPRCSVLSMPLKSQVDPAPWKDLSPQIPFVNSYFILNSHLT